MKKFKKEFVYRGCKFNTTVELNVRAERHLGGERYHRVTTYDMEGDINYYEKHEVPAFKLEETILKHEREAKIYLDIEKDDIYEAEENFLINLGFK